jgi:hypothetical protein
LNATLLSIGPATTVSQIMVDKRLDNASSFRSIAHEITSPHGVDFKSVTQRLEQDLTFHFSGMLENTLSLLKSRREVGPSSAIQIVMNRTAAGPPMMAFVPNAREQRGAAEALAVLSLLSKDVNTINHAQSVIRAAQSVSQLAHVATLANATTGVGMVLLANTMFGAATGLSSGVTENRKLISEMYDYMRGQFLIVNAKLDTIIDALHQMQERTDNIQATLNQMFGAQLNMERRLSEALNEGEYAQLWRSYMIPAQNCQYRLRFGTISDHDGFAGCFGSFAQLAKESGRNGFVQKLQAREAIETLSRIADRREQDAMTLSRYGNIAVWRTSRTFNDYQQPLIINFNAMGYASDAITSLLRSSSSFLDRSKIDDDLGNIGTIAENAERSLKRWAGETPADQKLRAIELANEYKSTAMKLANFLDHSRSLAARAYADELAAELSLPANSRSAKQVGPNEISFGPCNIEPVKRHHKIRMNQINASFEPWLLVLLEVAPEDFDFCTIAEKRDPTQRALLGTIRVSVGDKFRDVPFQFTTTRVYRCGSLTECLDDARDDFNLGDLRKNAYALANAALRDQLFVGERSNKA